MAKDILNIGFVGVGNISGTYLDNITKRFKEIQILGVCDLVREKAESAVERYGIPKLYNDMYELFADPDIDIVLNITRPYEHYDVSKAALNAGKSVYVEKPLAATLEQGKELRELAAAKGLRLGGAPDTFLGAAIQSAAKLIKDGAIGFPIGGACHMIAHGHESWHPDPAFYYDKIGGGPMLDMGPYYVTALVNLLGPAEAVMGMTKTTFPTRTITSKPLSGTVIEVGCPTYYMGLIRFKNGAIVSIFETFDVYSVPSVNNIEIYGSEANLLVPDPNGFGGPVKIRTATNHSWEEAGNAYTNYGGSSRSLGLADMAKSIQSGRDARADVQQTYHVLEILSAFEKSSNLGQEVKIESEYVQPALRVITPDEGYLDA